MEILSPEICVEMEKNNSKKTDGNQQGISIVPVDPELLSKFLHAVPQILTAIDKGRSVYKNNWLTHAQTLKFLGVSDNTLRNYVNQGWIACSVVERKKFFRITDIEAFLMHPDNRRKAFQLKNNQ